MAQCQADAAECISTLTTRIQVTASGRVKFENSSKKRGKWYQVVDNNWGRG